jgi:hypothetical protein
MEELAENINAAKTALYNLKRIDNRLCLISCVEGAIFGEEDKEAALTELIYQAQRRIITLRETDDTEQLEGDKINQEYEARYGD